MPIVQVNVSQQVAPTPETLQQSGALVSQGGTATAPGTSSFLTQLSDLTPLLASAKALTSLTWNSGTVTGSTTLPHGFTTGDVFGLTIAGAVPAGYNGTFQATITGPSAFTYALSANPGLETTAGIVTDADVTELTAMATTFFAQGSGTGVSVLELGPGTPNEGIAALGAYITANPNSAYTPGATGFFYAYLVPREWDGNANYLALVAQFQSTTSRTYFFTTTTLANYPLYTVLQKAVFAEIEAPQMHVYPADAFVSLSWSNGTATGSTASAHGVTVGDWFQVAGVVPVGYNGWHQAAAGTTGSTLVWAQASNPGAVTTQGTMLANTAASSGIPAAEFSCAAALQNLLKQAPSSTNKVPPFAFTFQFGVTPFPTQGLSATLAALKAANVNYVGTGAEGGISTACLFWGTTMDGRDFLYWYSVDWAQITSDVNIANAVINGSNNPINPLYYSQDGINRLQDVIVATMNTAVTVGLANGTTARASLSGPAFTAALEAGTYAGKIVVNAIPYITYLTVNPGDYKIERYAGFSVQYIASAGFRSIVFNIVVTDFVAT